VSEELYRIEQQLASAIERSDVDAAGGLLSWRISVRLPDA